MLAMFHRYRDKNSLYLREDYSLGAETNKKQTMATIISEPY